MSDTAKGVLLIAAITILVAIIMALSGKTAVFDSDCTFSFDNGCIPGKPIKIQDDNR